MISNVDTKSQHLLRWAISQDDKQSGGFSFLLFLAWRWVLNRSPAPKSGLPQNGVSLFFIELQGHGQCAVSAWYTGCLRAFLWPRGHFRKLHQRLKIVPRNWTSEHLNVFRRAQRVWPREGRLEAHMRVSGDYLWVTPS